MQNKYSIILPVRNGGKHFRECVRSILSQSYRNFNLHILDNCSTDGLTEWITSLKDDRIILIHSQESLTIEASWKRIVGIKKNEFITLIGHDDLLHENYLAVMDRLISMYPEAALYQTHFNIIDENGKEVRKCKPMSVKENASQFLASILSNNLDVFGTGYMMRSKDYDKIGGIPLYPNLLFADFELWIQLTRLSYKVTSQAECFSYRLHQSATKNSPDVKMHEAFSKFVHYLEKIKEEDSNLNEVIRQCAIPFLYIYCKGLSHRLIRTPLSKREKLDVRSFIDKCKEYANSLVPKNDFNPDSVSSIRLAKFIDSNRLSRELFLWFKKLYSKPILK